MKKILTILIATMLLASCGNKETEKTENSTWNGSTVSYTEVKPNPSAKIEVEMKDFDWEFEKKKDWEVVDAFGGLKKWEDIINEKSTYIYYHSKDCTYCQTLKQLFSKSDIYNAVAIEKKEVAYNEENMKELQKIVEEKKVRASVPFMMKRETKEVFLGIDQITTEINKTLTEEYEKTLKSNQN